MGQLFKRASIQILEPDPFFFFYETLTTDSTEVYTLTDYRQDGVHQSRFCINIKIILRITHYISHRRSARAMTMIMYINRFSFKPNELEKILLRSINKLYQKSNLSS